MKYIILFICWFFLISCGSKELLENWYSKDHKNAYINDEIIEWSDSESFVLLWEWYSKDKNNVYFYKNIIDKADSNSFQLIKYWYSKDDNYVYYVNDIIESADPKTFEVVSELWYSKDINNVYYEGIILSEIWLKTAKEIISSHHKDDLRIRTLENIKSRISKEKINWIYPQNIPQIYIDSYITEFWLNQNNNCKINSIDYNANWESFELLICLELGVNGSNVYKIKSN